MSPQGLGGRGLVLRNMQVPLGIPEGSLSAGTVEGLKGLHTEPQRASFFAAGVLFTGGGVVMPSRTGRGPKGASFPASSVHQCRDVFG